MPTREEMVEFIGNNKPALGAAFKKRLDRNPGPVINVTLKSPTNVNNTMLFNNDPALAKAVNDVCTHTSKLYLAAFLDVYSQQPQYQSSQEAEARIAYLEAKVERLQKKLIEAKLEGPTDYYNWDNDSMPYNPEGPFPSSQ